MVSGSRIHSTGGTVGGVRTTRFIMACRLSRAWWEVGWGAFDCSGALAMVGGGELSESGSCRAGKGPCVGDACPPQIDSCCCRWEGEGSG